MDLASNVTIFTPLIWLVWKAKLVAIDSFERYQADGSDLETRKLKGGKDYTQNVCIDPFNVYI